jgi:hypothetical protein
VVRATVSHTTAATVPFVWVENSPRLLADNAPKILVMIQHAEAKLKRDFELPVAVVLTERSARPRATARSVMKLTLLRPRSSCAHLCS